MMIATLLITFTIFLVLGVPIAFAMGLSGVIALFAASDISLLVLPQRMFSSLDSFTLLAVPLFVLAGAAEGHDALGNAAHAHQFAGQHEERHGQEREAVERGKHALRQHEQRNIAGGEQRDNA